MSSLGTSHSGTQWQTPQSQGQHMNTSNDANEDGVSIRPMRLKILYTFDDQNKTNCLARGNDVLQIKTVAMDETATIGIIELKTCIELVIQSSPELVARLGQDYTIYAYDYSEYDTPLVGQGMLSRALASASTNPDAPAPQNPKLITGRVCKNILGIFNNGVKETLEVKLRLVPVPTAMQGEYVNAMEMYREMSRAIPAGFDLNEWNAFLQSNPGVGQIASKVGAPPSITPNQRGSLNMEVVNQLLSPSLQQQPSIDPFCQANAENSGNESRGGTSNGGQAKETTRPSSRASVKRPRKPRQTKASAAGGNTSGYEEGTDGDDAPAPKKRAKITKTDWKSKSSFGPASDSLRVAASTAGSLRMFRPIAMSPVPNVGSHMQELPRAPTPVPNITSQNLARDRAPSQSGLRRDSTASQTEASRKHIRPCPPVEPPVGLEDHLRYSIESAGPSPERNLSPADTPPDIGSSPPVMRSGSPLRSSPLCPSSPLLPQMPRTDSGFMSGTLDDLFGEDDEAMRAIDDEDVEIVSKYSRRRAPRPPPRQEVHHGFAIEEVVPGPVELLPTRMLIQQPPKPKAAPKPPRSRAGSVMSEDGQQCLPPLKAGSRPASRRLTPTRPEMDVRMLPILNGHEVPLPGYQFAETQQLKQPEEFEIRQPEPQRPSLQDPSTQVAPPPPLPASSQSRPGSRMMVRTASMGSLTLPTIPASDPVLPLSSLQRSQTWSEVPYPITEAPMPNMSMAMAVPMPPMAVPPSASGVAYSRTLNAKKAAIKQKLELAVANGEMPPYCSNCGAIETPTWRKAWSQEKQGPPGYYEYSDKPGKVTAIVILGRDDEGKPTSYQLIKKFLLPEEDQSEWNEFLLCNPCGIWMSKYKSQRPEEKWECNRNSTDKKGPERRRPTQRPAKPKKVQPAGILYPTSEANLPPSDAYFPHEVYYPKSEGLGSLEEVSSSETPGTTQQQDLPVQRTQRQRSASVIPVKGLHVMTSDTASAVLRRAIQSSPARWVGTQHSPIEVEGEYLGSTRRLLFPSPRKDGSPKVLGEMATNVVQIATDFRSPKEPTIELPNKENYPPAVNGDDDEVELLKFFENEIARPTTPVRKSPPSNPFKTPTRPTPNHRPITRSVSKSIRSAKSPGQLLTFRQTPSRTPSSRRRSPRNHQAAFESPFTATLNQLMSDANNHVSPSRNGLQLDFANLPDLPVLDGTPSHGHADRNFNIEDFFSTDVPMPSSPPRLFHLYVDPLTMSNMDWNEFGDFNTSMLDNSRKGDDGARDLEIKTEPGTVGESGEPTEDTETSGK